MSFVLWDECFCWLGMMVGLVVEDGGVVEMVEMGGGCVGMFCCCMVGGVVVGGGIGIEGVVFWFVVV